MAYTVVKAVVEVAVHVTNVSLRRDGAAYVLAMSLAQPENRSARKSLFR